MPVAHVGYVHAGNSIVTPTLQWREGDRIYWHGAAHGRMMQATDGAEVCLTVSILDGLVLARAAYNFNINHRSVMVFGKPEPVLDATEKTRLLKRFVDGYVPGQWEKLRPVTEQGDRRYRHPVAAPHRSVGQVARRPARRQRGRPMAFPPGPACCPSA